MKAGFIIFWQRHILRYQSAWLLSIGFLLLMLTPQVASANISLGCGNFPGPIPIPDIPCLLGETILKLTSVVTAIIGNVFDLVLNIFVFGMKDTLEGAPGSIFSLGSGDDAVPTYRIIWQMVRDLANLSFIFILIYAALATIFQVKKVEIKRVVPQLILVAILMNFSLFFVQIAVDMSNFVAYQFYTSVTVTTADETGTIGSRSGITMSKVIANVTNITALVAPPTDSRFVDSNTTSTIPYSQQPGFFYGLMASVFVGTAGLVMLAGALLLFIRFFMIMVYMIASPIALASTILENTKETFFHGWWLKGLISQLTFAPAYFGMMYLALRFLQAISSEGLAADDSNVFAFWVKTALLFLVSSAFLIFSIIAAKQMGAAGGNFADGMLKKTTGNYGLNPLKRTGSFAGRNIIGGGGRLAGKGMQRAGISLRDSNSKILKYSGSALGKKGVSLEEKAEGAKFGGVSLKEKKDKRKAQDQKLDKEKLEVEREKLMKKVNASNYTLTDDEKKKLKANIGSIPQKDVEKLLADAKSDKSKAAIAEALSFSTYKKMQESEMSPEDKENLKKSRYGSAVKKLKDPQTSATDIQTLQQSLSADELKELRTVDKTAFDSHAHELTPDQVEGLKKAIEPADYKEMMGARATKLNNEPITPGGNITRAQALRDGLNSNNLSELENMEKALKQMGAQELVVEQGILSANKEMVALLSKQQYDNLMSSNSLTQEQKTRITTARTTGLQSIASGPNSSLLINRSPKEIAQLPSSILTQDSVARNLSAATLNTITTEGNLSQADRNIIKSKIVLAAGSPGAPPTAAAALDYLTHGVGKHTF